jgi:hypothetical protein
LLGFDEESAGNVTRTGYSYSGRTVTYEEFDHKPHVFFQRVQVVDDQNRVIDLRVSEDSDGKLKLWYHTTFRYDDLGRVVEQNTDPYDFGEGDDYSPLPGKVVTKFEGETKDVKYFDPARKLMLHSVSQLDRDGIETSMKIFDGKGKEKTGSEIFIDSKTHESSERPGSIAWEVIYDEHGNWTERRRWFKPAGGSDRILVRVIRQTIKYR